MSDLLMRRQVIPANFVVFCNRCNYCHISGSHANELKKEIIFPWELSTGIKKIMIIITIIEL